MDFIGRESLLKHKENGIKKKLCMLAVETTDVDPEGNETIWFGGKVVECPSFVTQQRYSLKFVRCCSLLTSGQTCFCNVLKSDTRFSLD